MRVIDLFLPHLDRIERVDDLDGPGGMLRYLTVPPGKPDPERVTGETDSRDRVRGKGDATCVLLPADAWSDPWSAFDAALAAAEPGAQFFVFVEGGLLDWPGTRLLSLCSHRGAQVVEAMPLTYERVQLAFVVERADRLVTPRRYLFGEPGEVPDDQNARRVWSESVVADVVARAAEERVREIQDEVRRRNVDLHRLDALERQLSERGQGKAHLRLTLEREQREHAALRDAAEEVIAGLRRELRRAQRHQALAERRLAQVEASSSLRVGQAVVSAAREPRSLVRLPKRLREAWAQRDEPTDTGTGPTGDDSGFVLPDPSPRRLTVRSSTLRGAGRLALALRTDERLHVAMIAPDEIADEYGAVANLHRLRPETAGAVGESTYPDLLVVFASAGRDAGAWFGLGSFAGAQLARQLTELLQRCADMRIPTCLVLDCPTHQAPTMQHLRDLVDVEVHDGPAPTGTEWRPGVSLGRWYGMATTGRVAVDDALRVLGPGGRPSPLDIELAREGVCTVTTSPMIAGSGIRGVAAHDLPGRLVRARALVVAPGDQRRPADLAVRAVLAGVPVMSLDGAVPALPGVHQIEGANELPGAEPLPPDEATRSELVALLEQHQRTASATLDILAAMHGLPSSGARVTALVSGDCSGVAASLLDAARRPDEVLVAGEHEDVAGFDELRLGGVSVRRGDAQDVTGRSALDWTMVVDGPPPAHLGTVLALAGDGLRASAVLVSGARPVRLLRNDRLDEPTARAWLVGDRDARVAAVHEFRAPAEVTA